MTLPALTVSISAELPLCERIPRRSIATARKAPRRAPQRRGVFLAFLAPRIAIGVFLRLDISPHVPPASETKSASKSETAAGMFERFAYRLAAHRHRRAASLKSTFPGTAPLTFR